MLKQLIKICLDVILTAIFGIICGVITALAALGFVGLINTLNDLLLISARSRMMMAESIWLPVATVLVPCLGGLIVGSLWRFIPDRRPHGPSDAISSVQISNGTMPLKTGLITALGAALSLGSGASVGQYGPLVHLGSTLGSNLGAALGLVSTPLNQLRTIGLGCGSAAAIATIFNAPIAGLVFAHEVILRHYSLRTFTPVAVAAASGYVIANVIFDQPPLFRIAPVGIVRPEEFAGFIVLGIGGALVALAFMRAILWSGRLAAGWQAPQALKPAVAGLLLGLVALELPDILGAGKEVLRFAIIEHAFSSYELVLILIAKLLLTALCIGFGFAGGVFSPALLIGIVFGALMGNNAELIWGAEHSHVAVYAICGMVAVTSPVIGAPLTMILIVFELTRNYDLAIAAMVSLVFANMVSHRLFGASLFDVQLAARGLDLSLGRDKVILNHRLIADYISQDFIRIRPEQTLAEIKAILIAEQQSEAYVLDSTQHYIGTLTLHHVLALEQQGITLSDPAHAHATPEHLILSADTSIWTAMEQLGEFVGESIPVVRDSEHNELIGVVFEATLVNAYLDTMYTIRREEHAN